MTQTRDALAAATATATATTTTMAKVGPPKSWAARFNWPARRLIEKYGHYALFARQLRLQRRRRRRRLHWRQLLAGDDRPAHRWPAQVGRRTGYEAALLLILATGRHPLLRDRWADRFAANCQHNANGPQASRPLAQRTPIGSSYFSQARSIINMLSCSLCSFGRSLSLIASFSLRSLAFAIQRPAPFAPQRSHLSGHH